MDYNQNSRKKNAFLISSMGIVQQLSQLIWTFLYRTIFLYFLSKEYLGLNGLFTNVLQLFSLAELGIGSSILYRMYKPFAEMNKKKIAAYMNFYKRVYYLIFVIIVLLGVVLFPFLSSIVNMNEVPNDIQLNRIYVLFVIQSASSYLFVYKQSIVTVDQKGYQISVFTIILDLVTNLCRILALFLTKDYESVLFIGVTVQIVLNFIYSRIITIKYKAVFRCKDQLSKNEKEVIYKDTFGLMCHKIGNVVLTSTDNIVLSKICGLISVGIYSNYSIIVSAITSLITRIFGSFSPVVGNYALEVEKEELYELYIKLEFVNMWIAGFSTSCLFSLLNPFLENWLDRSFLLSSFTVALICIQHYLKASWLVTSTMLEGCGLFMKDKLRPLIESILNLVISIICAFKWGIVGVFLGTVISGALTYYWRGPYLLFKYSINGSVKEFIRGRLIWLLLTVTSCVGAGVIQSFFPISWLGFGGGAVLIVVATNLFYYLFMRKNKNFKYFQNIFLCNILKIK